MSLVHDLLRLRDEFKEIHRIAVGLKEENKELRLREKQYIKRIEELNQLLREK